MQEVSHQDASRSGVGTTAAFVARMRAIENSKAEEALVTDIYAESLAGEISIQDMLEKFTTSQHSADAFNFMVDGMAVRTKKIDDEICKSLENVQQVVVLGAGLDSRPWRLQIPSNENPITWLELDFPEVFQYKLDKLSECNAQTPFNYVAVEADLSLPDWSEKLLQCGNFDPLLDTVWLLEGLTGYLTEEEIKLLFEKITNCCIAGTRLIATFISPDLKLVSQGLHKFKTREPLEFVADWGWEGSMEDFTDIGARYGRDLTAWKGYFLVDVRKNLPSAHTTTLFH